VFIAPIDLILTGSDVLHYWIVDPPAQQVKCHRLVGTEFQTAVEAEGDATLTHPDFDGLALDLAALWG
jgi:Uma2 family endonuclease